MIILQVIYYLRQDDVSEAYTLIKVRHVLLIIVVHHRFIIIISLMITLTGP